MPPDQEQQPVAAVEIAAVEAIVRRMRVRRSAHGSVRDAGRAARQELDQERAAHIARCWPGVSPERLKTFLDEACTGTPEKIAQELDFYIERGAELIILWFQDLADVGSGTSMAERFMKEVKPLLKEGA